MKTFKKVYIYCDVIIFIKTKLFLQKEKKERKKSETEVEVDGTKELHVTLSPRTPGGDPPETEELIKALMVNNIFILILIENNIEIEKPLIKPVHHKKLHIKFVRYNKNGFYNFFFSCI